MTEAEWLTCEDPTRMLAKVVRNGVPRRVSELGGGADWASFRKLRLWACAVTRQAGLAEGIPAVEAAERYADGLIDEAKFHSDVGPQNHWCAQTDRQLLVSCHELTRLGSDTARFKSHHLADALRDIIGNPFRPVAVRGKDGDRFHGSAAGTTITFGDWAYPWLTPTVLSLAQAAYDERNTDGTLQGPRLMVLWDALEEAGCDSEELNAHLTRGGIHVRGCWVIDLLLGKD